MNATSQPPAPAPAEIPLSRSEKEKLLKQMYSLTHWIELIRLFGYRTLPMDQARNAIKPLAEQFGKEPVATACEVLVEISTQDKEPFARLKPHVRRMAFQILGPEPIAEAVVPLAEPQTPIKKPQPRERSVEKGAAKKRKPSTKPMPPTRGNTVRETSNGHATIMQQYRAAKEKHPGMLLLFRIGDFFELFDQDAETAHKLLGLTLTTRDRSISMAGFPHHQLEAYLQKLLHAGQRVAVCEPVDESIARGPIRREITRVVTPGTMPDEVGTAKKQRQPDEKAQPVRQPRVHVLKQYEAWLKKAGLAFVAGEDVKQTTPPVAPVVRALDYIVLRGDEKLLVTVRPHLQAKHVKAIAELQKLFGADYRPVRIWPNEGSNGWEWHDQPIDVPTAELAEVIGDRPKPKRTRSTKHK